MSERTNNPKILPILIERWSPRSYDGNPIPMDDLTVMFEAAGLATSAYNYQPWTFLYALPGDANWDLFMGPLVEFNQSWVKDAGVLGYLISERNMTQGDNSNPNHSHSFDAGSAWMNLALQAHHMGYHAHGMSGVDFDKAAADLAVPDTHRVEMAFAIGTKAPADKLPEGLREREVISGRKPVSEIFKAGKFA